MDNSQFQIYIVPRITKDLQGVQSDSHKEIMIDRKSMMNDKEWVCGIFPNESKPILALKN